MWENIDFPFRKLAPTPRRPVQLRRKPAPLVPQSWRRISRRAVPKWIRGSQQCRRGRGDPRKGTTLKGTWRKSNVIRRKVFVFISSLPQVLYEWWASWKLLPWYISLLFHLGFRENSSAMPSPARAIPKPRSLRLKWREEGNRQWRKGGTQ